jgi:hypothetical protein
MNQKQFAGGVILAVAFSLAQAAEQAWPRLLNGEAHPECRAALELGRFVQKSTDFRLWGPFPWPDNFSEELVLGPTASNLQSEQPVYADEDVFTEVEPPPPEPFRHSAPKIFGQTQTGQSHRLIVEQHSMGWRGDQYFVEYVPAGPSVVQYAVAAELRGTAPVASPIPVSMRVPTILQSKRGDRLWVIHVGQAYEFSSPWVVYLPIGGKMEKACEIRFRPDVSAGAALLPGPVRKLAALMHQSLGNESAESGYLHTITTLKLLANQVWANVALRPWAVDSPLTDENAFQLDKPWDSREDVEAGLLAWSKADAGNRKIYAAIQTQLRISQKVLSAYYMTRFKMSKAESQATASRVLDFALRAHYVFPRLHEHS